MEDAGTEEEAAAAARAAAEKREERLQEQSLAEKADAAEETTEKETETNGDIRMEDDAATQVEPTPVEDDDEIDPLEAFMEQMGDPFAVPNHLEDYVHRAGRTGRAGAKGTAVTFITEEQEQYSVGIAKALEQSGQPVPERLNEMRKSFRDKVKTGKSKDSSGFGGKGLERLDAEREAARNRERKTHKTDGDDEEEKEDKTGDEDIVLKAASVVQP